MSAWQPIATAPRDGTRVLIYVPSRFVNHVHVATCWDVAWESTGDYGPAWYPGCSDGTGGWLGFGDDEVTGWQMLPPPPLSAEEEMGAAHEPQPDEVAF